MVAVFILSGGTLVSVITSQWTRPAEMSSAAAQLLRQYDLDRDGVLDRAELQAMLADRFDVDAAYIDGVLDAYGEEAAAAGGKWVVGLAKFGQLCQFLGLNSEPRCTPPQSPAAYAPPPSPDRGAGDLAGRLAAAERRLAGTEQRLGQLEGAAGGGVPRSASVSTKLAAAEEAAVQTRLLQEEVTQLQLDKSRDLEALTGRIARCERGQANAATAAGAAEVQLASGQNTAIPRPPHPVFQPSCRMGNSDGTRERGAAAE